MQPTLAQTLQSAVQHHQAGRFAEAEAIYRQVLIHQPQNPDALHLLGVLAHQSGKHEAGLQLIQQAVDISPRTAVFRVNLTSVLMALNHLDEALDAAKVAVELDPESAAAQFALGQTLIALGRFDEAIGSLRRAVQIKPDFSAAYRNLAGIFKSQGKRDDAIAAYVESTRVGPNIPEDYFHLGSLLSDQGTSDRAVAAYREAVRLKPDYAEAWSNLGTALKDLGRLDDAVAAYRESLRLNPDYPETHNNLGNVLGEQGNADEAVAEYRQALRLRPDAPLAYYNLGIARGNQCKPDEAAAAYREAIRLDPDYADAHTNLALTFVNQGKLQEAIESFASAIRIRPDFGEAHFGLAAAFLLRGDYENGWRELEWRWESVSYRGAQRPFPHAQWNGRNLDGKHILLSAEGGLGDTIQFVRYIPLVAARGGKVILECQSALVPLLRNLTGLEQIISAGAPLPRFDFVCTLMSLPLYFKTTLETIPASFPYIHADPERAETWSRKMPSEAKQPRIGLVWAGNPDNKNLRYRSMSLPRYAPLAAIKNARFYSLQVGPGASEISNPPPGLELIDFTCDLHDFADTAAMIANLDLVISIDTSVAHLAGAMGKPVWVLVPFAPDWRWLLARDDSPWYPSMRLFRQNRPNDWSDVIGEVMRQLRRIAQSE